MIKGAKGGRIHISAIDVKSQKYVYVHWFAKWAQKIQQRSMKKMEFVL